jgi:L-aspartate semialdehyde sulfurtransferase ferredoxin
MITIAIDEAACRSCTLCVEECPTKVLAMDAGAKVPRVAKAAECFGCLSCSEVCPSDAIRHDQLPPSEAYHHNETTLRVASRLGCATPSLLATPVEKWNLNRAVADLSVRLLSVGAVFKDILGTGLPAAGTLAGHTLALQRPRYRLPQNMDEAATLAQETFAPAFDIKPKVEGTRLTVDVGACFVRELCAAGKTTLGGELCILFYHCLAGYLTKMGKAHPHLVTAERSMKTCQYVVEVGH